MPPGPPDSQQAFPQPAPGHRDWYAHEALRALPRLVLMADKNPFSPTYGCFDRAYWHYRTMDFPCGMNQEFVLPLALAATTDLPHNPWHGNRRLRELALAGVDFAAHSAHRDGSCDDYFPFERALGAVTFSLYAMSESMLVLDDRAASRLDFIARRGDWLRTHNETGRLANHQAFAALALYNVYVLTGEKRFLRGSNAFRDLALSWQHSEGWFQEYEGADPGYHSCLVSFLAKLWQKSQDETLLRPLEDAVRFAWWFMHPDGSYAGEYGSRNTYHFYPHGFEIMAPRVREAGQVADTFLWRAMPRRSRYFNDDDRMAAHYVYDWMQSWRDYAGGRPGPIDLPGETQARWFPGARLHVVRTPHYHAVVAANKGGTFKAHTPDGPLAGDTGLVAELEDGTVTVTHLVHEGRAEVAEAGRRVTVACPFHRRRQPLPTPWRQIAFRVLTLTLGRLHANAVRAVLQKVLITGKAPLPLACRREMYFDDDAIRLRDTITQDGPPAARIRLRRLGAGPDATSIYVANSNVFQESVLLPWRWFPRAVRRFNQQGGASVRRAWKAAGRRPPSP